MGPNMPPTSDSSSSARTSSQNTPAPKELADLIRRYNAQHDDKLNPTLNELIYVVLRLGDSIRQDPKYQGGWNELVKEVKRRLYGHLNGGTGYQQQNPEPLEREP